MFKMHRNTQHILTLLANTLLVGAILVFGIGFFPHKAVLPGLASWPPELEQGDISAPFDRVIFMVVDALRSDFVYSNASNFHFTQSLIRSGAAVPFTGHASAPTITMPRVKAITTGSVPSFIDLVLNFAESDTTSTLATQDSWLAQMRAKPNGKLVMFGDDTWLRLFPGFFERSDGTTSFFVSDFTEVDHNVTRNIPDELLKDDWSAMILHYLGLDHIGHKTGPQGPNMPAKQNEMDGIVQQIYIAMESSNHLKDSLLVLLGDHGMNEAGNHGASSSGETSTALAFISPKLKKAFGGQPSPINGVTDFTYYDVVEQSDIAATLASLLGFPVPKNSLGIIIPKLLEMWPDSKDRFEMMYANADQVRAIAQATFSDTFSNAVSICEQQLGLSDEEDLVCKWQRVSKDRQSVRSGGMDAKVALQNVSLFLTKAQSLLSITASKYDLTKMTIGIAMSSVAFVTSMAVCGMYMIESGVPGAIFIMITVVYAITMFASSYVEEEHQVWYWSTAAWLVYLGFGARRLKATSTASAMFANVMVGVLFGIARRWNQTGQKYAGDQDLVTEVLADSPWLLWTLVLVTYATISRRMSRRALNWGSKQMAIIPVIVTISAFLFKLAFTAADAPELLMGIRIFDPIIAFIIRFPLVSLARIVYLGLAHLLATAFFYEMPWTDEQHRGTFLRSFHDILSLFLITQTRTVNIPLFLIFYAQAGLSQSFQILQDIDLTINSLLMQYSSFFMFGGTNAISSIDLSNAYNGVSGYNVVAVGVLTFVSNWAGPIWWSSATSCLLEKPYKPADSRKENLKPLHFAILTLFATGSTLAVMVSCMALREHLFIWTVFSPKYLYVVAWIIGQHLVINGLLGSLVLGSRR